MAKHDSGKTSTGDSGYVGRHQANAERPSKVVVETVQGFEVGRQTGPDNYTER